jgi:hypothetical protein
MSQHGQLEGTTAYAICRTCIAVFPTGRRCPSCEGDAESARIVAEATAVALEPAQRVVIARRGGDRTLRLAGLSALASGLGILAFAAVAALL